MRGLYQRRCGRGKGSLSLVLASGPRLLPIELLGETLEPGGDGVHPIGGRFGAGGRRFGSRGGGLGPGRGLGVGVVRPGGDDEEEQTDGDRDQLAHARRVSVAPRAVNLRTQ